MVVFRVSLERGGFEVGQYATGKQMAGHNTKKMIMLLPWPCDGHGVCIIMCLEEAFELVS